MLQVLVAGNGVFNGAYESPAWTQDLPIWKTQAACNVVWLFQLVVRMLNVVAYIF
jgi:hypothetical protein